MPTFAELPPGLRVLAGGKSVVRRPAGGEAFLDIDFPRRVWADSEYSLRYHVYSSATERVSVEATSVIEALIVAGIDSPFKIERGTAVDELRTVVIGAGRLLAENDGDDAAPQSETAEPPAALESDAEADPVPAESGEAEPDGDEADTEGSEDL
jgi:hypothetical protein